MAAVKDMLAVVLLGLCIAVGVAHGFMVTPVPGGDSASQYSTVHGNALSGRLVNELKDFQMDRFPTYNAGVARSGNAVNANQFSDHTVPKRFSTSDSSSANQFRKQAGPVATHESSSGSSGDEGSAYNTRFQSETNDVNIDNAARYDYNHFSTSPGSSSSHRLPSTASYVLGDSEKREEARPEYARAGRNGATGASVTTLDVQEASGKVVPARVVPAGKSPSSYLYDARAGKHGGSIESVQHGSPAHRAVPAKGHQGPVSYYTPSSERRGAFFYDPRSVAQKNLSSTVDHNSASVASVASGATSSASTTLLHGTQQAPRGTHGCPYSYWAVHVGQWPAPLKITTLVVQAFGELSIKANLEIVYGTTTLFQALLDTRNDPYSKLLRHAVAAFLNAHAKTAFPQRPAEVGKLFHSALASEVAAAAQAQKFENENHAFGDNECK